MRVGKLWQKSEKEDRYLRVGEVHYDSTPIKGADCFFLSALHVDFLGRGPKCMPGQVKKIAAADKFQQSEGEGGSLKDDGDPESNGPGMDQESGAQAEHDHES